MQIAQRTATKRRADVERATFLKYEFARRIVAGLVSRLYLRRQFVVCVLHLFPKQTLCIIQCVGNQCTLCRLKQSRVELDDAHLGGEAELSSFQDDVAGVDPLEVFPLLRRHPEASRLTLFVGDPVKIVQPPVFIGQQLEVLRFHYAP